MAESKQLKEFLQPLVNVIAEKANIASGTVINGADLLATAQSIPSSEELFNKLKQMYEGPVTTVEVPNGVTKIRQGCFYNPDRNVGDVSLFKLSSSIEEIGAYAFYQQEYMTIEIPDDNNLKIVMDSGFKNFGLLGNINFPLEKLTKLEKVGPNAFSGMYYTKAYVPPSLKEIGNNAFESLGHLAYDTIGDIEITSNVQILGDYAFSKARSNNIILRQNPNFTTLGTAVFDHVYVNNSIIIEEGFTKLGKSCFDTVQGNSTSKISLHLPSTLINLDSRTFFGCTYIDKVYVKDLKQLCLSLNESSNPGVISSKWGVYRNVTEAYCNNELVKDLVIPELVNDGKTYTHYDYKRYLIYTFYYCNAYDSITLPSKIHSEGSKLCGTFYGSSVKNVYFNNNNTISSIEKETFCNCPNLLQLTIPQTVTTIGGTNVFNMGSSTQKYTVIFESSSPCSLSSGAFATANLNKIIVPKNCAAAYKAATNWSTYASYIFEPNTITFNVDSSLLNNENVLYSIDGAEEQQFTQASFTGENLSTLKVTSKTADITVLVGTTQGGSEIGTVANASTVFTFESDTTIYITKQ